MSDPKFVLAGVMGWPVSHSRSPKIHNYWLQQGPGQFPNTAIWDEQPDLANPFTADIDSSFPKGAALKDWLVNVGASVAPGGKLEIKEGQLVTTRAGKFMADGIASDLFLLHLK